MTDKPIQEQFGETILEAIRGFAKADLEDVAKTEKLYLSHVGDATLRRTLAETLYGTRWIYKLGLALLVRDEEQMAHVRCQVIDYGSVCEGVLSDMIHHALVRGLMHGTKYQYSDTKNLKDPIKWRTGREAQELGRRSFHWIIEVAENEGVIDCGLAVELQKLRTARNTVHLRARTHKAFVGTSRAVFNVLRDTLDQTRLWKARNP